MTIAFFSNFLNHHQLPLCEEFYKEIGDKFTFVAMEKFSYNDVSKSYEDMNKAYPFCLEYYENESNAIKAKKLAINADIVIFACVPPSFFKERIKQNKITFRYSERVFKPAYIKNYLYTYLCTIYENLFFNNKKNVYLLSNGAFTAHDFKISLGLNLKAFKWGYFPQVSCENENNEIEKLITDECDEVRILWVGRMLGLKHAERVLPLLNELNKQNINFKFTFVGDGPMREELEKIFEHLSSYVEFVGTATIEETRKFMCNNDIFIFTSDVNEGWGAVLSEAMSDGCAVIASCEAGASCFLIEDGKNGVLADFTTEKGINDFVKLGTRLVQDINIRQTLSKNAAKTMRELWCAKTAVKRFLSIAKALLNNEELPIYDNGPCSKDTAISIKTLKKQLEMRNIDT